MDSQKFLYLIWMFIRETERQKFLKKIPEVFTFSVHGEKNYPTRKEKSSLDIGLPDKTEDAYYLKVVEENLSKIIDCFEPEIVFYNSGVDILESDKLGRLSVSKNGAKKKGRNGF
jgi:acetoin utilization deacetylase AcuC-like enzyme